MESPCRIVGWSDNANFKCNGEIAQKKEVPELSTLPCRRQYQQGGTIRKSNSFNLRSNTLVVKLGIKKLNTFH
jgi:hypothetical protein